MPYRCGSRSYLIGKADDHGLLSSGGDHYHFIVFILHLLLQHLLALNNILSGSLKLARNLLAFLHLLLNGCEGVPLDVRCEVTIRAHRVL